MEIKRTILYFVKYALYFYSVKFKNDVSQIIIFASNFTIAGSFSLHHKVKNFFVLRYDKCYEIYE